MIESWLFVFAVIMVLLIPDSSNAMLANSAHQQGILKTLKFIPIGILSYFYGISLWALIVHLGLPVWPVLLHILHVCSGMYVIWLASRLWKISQLEKHRLKYPELKSKHIFLTILKNPKVYYIIESEKSYGYKDFIKKVRRGRIKGIVEE